MRERGGEEENEEHPDEAHCVIRHERAAKVEAGNWPPMNRMHADKKQTMPARQRV